MAPSSCEATSGGMSALEIEREQRIRANNERMKALGIGAHVANLTNMFPVKRAKPAVKKSTMPKVPVEAERKSGRIANRPPEHKGLEIHYDDVGSAKGRLVLPKDGVVASDDEEEDEGAILEYRCQSKGRGSVYDSKAGICCHFCRQKKLCGEADCPRCSTRDTALECIGKSKCAKCKGATGMFCRACLMVRYGLTLEEVRANKDWMCPHCYEEEHPEEKWICNSSICMTRRGLKPTGIAIFEARDRGFKSVGHYLQAQLRKRDELSSAGSGGSSAAAKAKKVKASSKPQVPTPATPSEGQGQGSEAPTTGRVAKRSAAAAAAAPPPRPKRAKAGGAEVGGAKGGAAGQLSGRRRGAQDLETVEEGEVYEAESVCGQRRGKGGRSEYLVKWRGYPASENTWEPKANVAGAMALLREFIKRTHRK